MRTNVVPTALALLSYLGFGTACGDKGGSTTPEVPAATGPAFGRHAADKGNGPFTATHILIGARNPSSPQVERSKNQALTAALEVMKRLGSGTRIEDIVTRYTDDKGSLGRPGEPDGQYTFGPGRMVPAFEQAVRETPVGKIYPEPVETEFGYHIIRRDK